MRSKYKAKKVFAFVYPDGKIKIFESLADLKHWCENTPGEALVFDSEKEYKRWCELRLLEKAGAIQNLQRQVPFEIIPPYTEVIERYGKKGQRLKDQIKTIEKVCYYKADFTYYENGKLVVEDTKGFKTEAYVMKRKLMLHKFGIRIKET